MEKAMGTGIVWSNGYGTGCSVCGRTGRSDRMQRMLRQMCVWSCRKKVENDIVEEMDREAVAEIPSEAGTESGKTDAEASDIDETAETDTEGSSTGEAVGTLTTIVSCLEVEWVTEVELSPFAVQASN